MLFYDLTLSLNVVTNLVLIFLFFARYNEGGDVWL